MKAPLDYATGEGDALGVEAGDITYAALLDRHAAEEPITDEMIRRACLRTESAQSWPFTDPEAPSSTGTTAGATTGATLARLFRVLR